jgi:hypothetical protein
MFGESAEGTAPERTIARIWRVTLDRLAGQPLTADLLRIIAWYAPDAIPRSLLTPASRTCPPPARNPAARRLQHDHSRRQRDRSPQAGTSGHPDPGPR